MKYINFDSNGNLICNAEPIKAGEKKPDGCLYPHLHRCKWCEYNTLPELSDGICKLLSKGEKSCPRY